VIGDLDGWNECLHAAAQAAEEGAIVTLGIRPSRAETGYGYIEYVDSAERPTQAGIHKMSMRDLAPRTVARFVEKPDSPKAAQYLEAGNFLWNAGIFVARTSVMLGEIQRQLPELYKGLETLAAAWRTPDWGQTLTTVFPTLPSISVDYGVMENAEFLQVIPASFEWSDVGHWGALDETLATDADDNVRIGDSLVLESHRNVVVNMADKMVVTLGVDDLIVVDTGDALLVAPRSRAQDVKKVVEALEAGERTDLL